MSLNHSLARPRILFLDAGGVLVDPDWDRAAAVLADVGIHVDPRAMARADAIVRRSLDIPAKALRLDDRGRGSQLFRGVLRSALEEFDPSAEDAAVAALTAAHAEDNLWTSVPADVPAALDRVAAAGIPMVVVSNADGSVERTLHRAGLGARFHTVIDSGRVGVEKPDPEIFRIALRTVGADPGSVLHVGDFYEIDVRGARAAGIAAALIDGAGLQMERDCPRFTSLGALVDAVLGLSRLR